MTELFFPGMMQPIISWRLEDKDDHHAKTLEDSSLQLLLLGCSKPLGDFQYKTLEGFTVRIFFGLVSVFVDLFSDLLACSM